MSFLADAIRDILNQSAAIAAEFDERAEYIRILRMAKEAAEAQVPALRGNFDDPINRM